MMRSPQNVMNRTPNRHMPMKNENLLTGRLYS